MNKKYQIASNSEGMNKLGQGLLNKFNDHCHTNFSMDDAKIVASSIANIILAAKEIVSKHRR